MSNCHPDTDRMVAEFEAKRAAVKTESKRRTFICRICDHDAGPNPLDTWRCKACLYTNVLDLTEIT